MGFIGAGAILRKGNLVRGLTTAATLWFTTTLEWFFGGGQLILGASVLVIGLVVLDGLKWVEKRRKQDRRATLTLAVNENGPNRRCRRTIFERGGYEIGPWALSYIKPVSQRELRVEVRWRAYPEDIRPPIFLQKIINQDGVIKADWNP
jgi:putative Mg2+ transporter-C (MgtC) family protein